MFTQTLACKLSNRIAAFASVSGSLPLPLKSNFQPNTAVSVLMINGTVDPLMPYQGSFVARGRRGEVVCVSETIELWRKHNGCVSRANLEQLADNNPNDNTQVEISRYSGCRGGSEIMLVSIKGGGRSWSGGAYPMLPTVTRQC